MKNWCSKLSLLAVVSATLTLNCGPTPTTGQGGTAGVAGSSGVGGSGVGGSSGGGSFTNPGFVNLAPPMGAALNRTVGSPVTPAAPAGWLWYQIDGAVCRDGSPTGFYVRYSSSDKLLIYMEGGGACVSPGFCGYNPKSVNQILAGDLQTAVGSIGGAIAGRQQPGVTGIFDDTNATNPFRNWNKVYVPYCTGDVHFGSRPNGTLPGVVGNQQFVGYSNTKKFIARLVPTFQGSVNRVILTGSSAGSFAAGLNFSMVQDSFSSTRVDVIMDSGVPFPDQNMPLCMQQRWRANWNLNDSMPPDCPECRQANGGGLLGLADFLIRKHPVAKIGVVSAMQDDIMRLFFSVSNNNCATYETADPILNFLSGIFPGDQYTAGLNGIRSKYAGTGRLSTYYLGGANLINHQHIWRPRFYDAFASPQGESIAQWAGKFMNGQMEQVGP